MSSTRTAFALFTMAYLMNVSGQGRSWGTYYGGENGASGRSCAVAADGSVYVAGSTSSTSNIATNGHQNTYGGGGDAFLAKFSADGTRLWATYYGGSGTEGASSCAVDANGNVYLAGSTTSSSGIAVGGHQTTYGGGSSFQGDAFLVKFDASGALLWSTYYGGNGPETGYSCAVDGAGNVYLSGWSASANGIADNGHQNLPGGQGDAFLVKFNANGVRLWGTYYGGNLPDFAFSCNVGPSNEVYITGNTLSTDGIAENGHQNAAAWHDAFLVKFDPDGMRLWGTFYGGMGADSGYSCAVDALGNVYMAGTTGSTDGIAANAHQLVFGGGALDDAFLVKFSPSGTRLWGTYYGGGESGSANGWDDGHSCAVDAEGNVYLSGQTQSTDGIASNAFQSSYGGGGGIQGAAGDAFLAKFDTNGNRLWGTYYGADGQDRGLACAVGAGGFAYLTGYTSSNAGIADGGHQNSLVSAMDAFLVKFNSNGVGVSEQAAEQPALLYPNPFADHFTVRTSDGAPVRVVLYDPQGRLVHDRLLRGETRVGLSELASGTYTAFFWKELERIHRVTLIKQ